MVNFHLKTKFAGEQEVEIEPILRSKIYQMQRTGQEAELYFMHHYTEIDCFQNGMLQDARLFGDGYDFQITVGSRYYLAEVKGVGGESGGVRLTHKEFDKAKEYKSDFALTVISDLYNAPKINTIFDPLRKIDFTERETKNTQISYHSKSVNWRRAYSHA